MAFVGFLVMVNWGSVVNLGVHVQSLFRNTPYRIRQYDWVFGVLQYVIGLSITFAGIRALEPATLSLMSKVAPVTLTSVVVNCGTIVTILSLMTRIVGDLFIIVVGLSHRLINADIVNSLVVPLMILCLAAGYVVKRHFFFLI